MTEVKLHRLAYLPFGTFGRMELPDGTAIYTAERPWLGNHRSVSCIPEGVYECRPSYYHRGGYESVEVTGVPERSRILIHVGNWPADTEGCIVIGDRLTCMSGSLGVANSRDTFERLFIPQLGRSEWRLVIRPPDRALTWDQRSEEATA